MKKTTLSKIFGVAVVIALLASLIVAAVPAAALSFAGPGVTVTPSNISSPAIYDITFTGGLNLAATDTITVTFPAGTVLPATFDVDNGDIQFSPNSPTVALANVGALVGYNSVTRSVTFAVGAAATIGNTWEIKFTTAHNSVVNPGAPGSYSLTVATAGPGGAPPKEMAATSPAYTISVPTVISRYNTSGNFVGNPATIAAAFLVVQTGDTIKLGPGTYTESPVLAATVNHVTITTTGTNADTVIGNPATVFTLNASATFVTVDNITFKGQVVNAGANNTFQNCVVNFPGGGALVGALVTNTGNNFTFKDSTIDATANGSAYAEVCLAMADAGGGTAPFSAISNVTFKLGQTSALVQDVAITGASTTNFTASGCTFTGSSGIGYQDLTAGANATFKNNTFTSVQNASDYYSVYL